MVVPIRKNARAQFAALLVLAYVLLASAYGVAVPAWEAPDEPAHFEYVEQVALRHSLPVDHPGALGEEHQPPLYYLLGVLATLPANLSDPSGAFRANTRFLFAGHGGTDINAAIHGSSETFPFRGQALGLHLAREMSILLGAVTVILVIAIGWEIFPTQPAIGLLAAAFAAFDPQFLFVSAAVNNDNLLTCLSTGATWQMLRILRQPGSNGRQWIVLGGWTALAVLAKLTGLTVGVVAGILLLGLVLYHRSTALLVKGAVALLVPVLALDSWWFARNALLYHHVVGWAMDPQNRRTGPLRLGDLEDLLRTQFHSFWGEFGWMDVPAPSWFSVASGVLTLVGVVGIAWLLLGGRVRTWTGFQKAALGLLVLDAAVVELAVIGVVLSGCNGACYQGRFLFPAIGPLMLLLATAVVGLLPGRVVNAATVGFVVLLSATAIYMLARVIRPAYAIVALPTWQLWLVPNPADVRFGDSFRLRGYQATLESGGRSLRVLLFWEAAVHPDFDYSVFVHVVDRAGKLVAQKDQAPGADRGYPPSNWAAGDVVSDAHLIELPDDVPDGTYRLEIGVYNWQSGQVLPVVDPASNPRTAFVLDRTIRRNGQHWLVETAAEKAPHLPGALARLIPGW